MGAVTVMLHVDRDPCLGAICLDSPFVSFRQLAEDLAQSENLVFPVPSFLVGVALAVVRNRVKALADFDIEDLVPLNHAKRSFVPAIFMHGDKDTFISPRHSRQLYEAYQGDKEFFTVQGDHNTERSSEAIKRSVDFFQRTFRLGELDLRVAPKLVGPRAPPRAQKPGGGIVPPRGSVPQPVPQPSELSPHAPPPPLPQTALHHNASRSREGLGSKDALFKIEYTGNWQEVMEAMMEQAGVASPTCKRQLRITDIDGVEVKLFSGGGKVPGQSRFPLKVQQLQRSSFGKALRKELGGPSASLGEALRKELGGTSAPANPRHIASRGGG